MSSKTTSVRIDTDICKRIRQVSEQIRPKTTMQYLIEDAVERYLVEKEAMLKKGVPDKKT